MLSHSIEVSRLDWVVGGQSSYRLDCCAAQHRRQCDASSPDMFDCSFETSPKQYGRSTGIPFHVLLVLVIWLTKKKEERVTAFHGKAKHVPSFLTVGPLGSSFSQPRSALLFDFFIPVSSLCASKAKKQEPLNPSSTMSENDAPEAVEHTADYPEAIWSHHQGPKSYVSASSLQQQSGQRYKQSFPGSQATSPYGGYAVASSKAFDCGVNGNGEESKKRDRTICGISRALFIALMILAVVIIAAAVGGGVGGSMAVKYAVPLIFSMKGMISSLGRGSLR